MAGEGIINIRKPGGMTSHDVVGRVRRIVGKKRVGHTGTLDPEAEGVLPVAIGSAARVMQFLDLDLKTYRCELTLGRETDTEDIWGKEIRRAPEEQVNRITPEEVLRVMDGFRGVIDQVPPMYSALKVDGKRLYEYAREGKSVEVKSRRICIPEIHVEEMMLGRGTDSRIRFELTCTKGTYVRTVCHDAGAALGVSAVMSSLTRTVSGAFRIEDAVTLEELEAMNPEERDRVIRPPQEAMIHFGEVVFEPEYAKKLVNGLNVMERYGRITKAPEYQDRDFWLPMDEAYRRMYLAFDPSRRFLGVVRADRDKKYGQVFRPVKIFLQGGYVI